MDYLSKRNEAKESDPALSSFSEANNDGEMRSACSLSFSTLSFVALFCSNIVARDPFPGAGLLPSLDLAVAQLESLTGAHSRPLLL